MYMFIHGLVCVKNVEKKQDRNDKPLIFYRGGIEKDEIRCCERAGLIRKLITQPL